jgi:hypothetical protein
VSATADVSTTSSTYAQMGSMTATPASGVYVVTFSGSGNVASGGDDAVYALYSAGSIVQHSERNLSWNGGAHANALEMAMYTQAVVTVNGSQVIEMRYKTTSGSAFTVHGRSMILVKVG